MEDFSAPSVSCCPAFITISDSKLVDLTEKGVEAKCEQINDLIAVLFQMESKWKKWDLEYREVNGPRGPIMLDPIRLLRSKSISPSPPKRFYRTFWTKVAWRILQQSRQHFTPTTAEDQQQTSDSTKNLTLTK